MSTFPVAKKPVPGYSRDEVDAFLDRARSAYDGVDAQRLSAAEIRRVSFTLRKGGYATEQVDAALERLEDAFAARERDEARSSDRDASWLQDARTTAQVIINRLGRPAGERFGRAGAFTQGYNRTDVDRFTDRLLRYFRDGVALSIDEVRTIAFRPQRHGYREVQVDLLLDSVTDVMLSVR